jgi:DNA polymerase-3 subunit gamma/tau
MSYALYRKYRPQNFEELVGQSPVRRTLMEALKQGKMVHAYLFSGPRGTGKTSSARLIAKAIQCDKLEESGHACGKCTPCTLGATGDLIDLIEVDAASNRGIDEIRELRDRLQFAPSHSKAKVYIIDEVHMLTKEAFNALLKSLEEPPSHVYFILATTEIHKIPETILSRCQRYDFRRIAEKDIVARLQWIAQKENMNVELPALELLAKYADGGMRDAISLLEQFSSEALTEEVVKDRLGLGHHQACDELYGALGSADTQKALAVIESLHTDGYDLQQFTTAFLGLLRTKLHSAVIGNKGGVVPKLLSWVDLFDDAWIRLKRASIAQLPLEIAVIRATHSEKSADSAPATSTAAANPMQNSSAPTKRKEGLMHMDAGNQQLKQAYGKIQHPALKLSFQTAQLKKVEGKTMTFIFNSRFHYDKVHAAAGLVAVETALAAAMGKDIKLICELEEGSVIADAPAPVDTLGWETVEEKL